MPLYLHDKISNKTGVNAMNKIKRLEQLLEKKDSLLYLINRHAQNKERIWEGDETGYEDYINAINQEFNELSQDDSQIN
jgi:hypothetical protein